MSKRHRKLLRLMKDYRCGTGIFSPPPQARWCVRLSNMPRPINSVELTEKAAEYLRLLNEALNTPKIHGEVDEMLLEQIKAPCIDVPDIYGESPCMNVLADCEALRRFEMIPNLPPVRNYD